MVWLGPRRGALSDWLTQQWVCATGRRVDDDSATWLAGPVGKVTGVGRAFFDELAAEQGLDVDRGSGVRGLLKLESLRGPTFDPSRVDPDVAGFYERTSLYEMESWSEWCGAFKPFGWLLAVFFSRRLQQLNVPLAPLDSSAGTTSEVLHLRNRSTGELVQAAWVRQLRRTGNVLYAGSYSVARVPLCPDPCVKVVFPLPNGNGIVVLRPTVDDSGALTVTSSGRGFGDAGFYFTVRRGAALRARYVKTMRESIRVYADGGEVRADHTLRIFGLVFLRLHYRLRPVPREAVAPQAAQLGMRPAP